MEISEANTSAHFARDFRVIASVQAILQLIRGHFITIYCNKMYQNIVNHVN